MAASPIQRNKQQKNTVLVSMQKQHYSKEPLYLSFN